MTARWMSVFTAMLCTASLVIAQHVRPESTEEILIEGDVALLNCDQALNYHSIADRNFLAAKQEPEEKVGAFGILVYKDNTINLDWTTGQHARNLLENLRQEIHELKSFNKPEVGDILGLEDARKVWPKLRDIVCREYPGVRYFDLDGLETYCPGQPSKSALKKP